MQGPRIYVYDSTVDEPALMRATAIILGQRYMALIDQPYPHGHIAGYGYTPAQAARRARKHATTVRRSVGDAMVAEYP